MLSYSVMSDALQPKWKTHKATSSKNQLYIIVLVYNNGFLNVEPFLDSCNKLNLVKAWIIFF